MGPDHYVVYHGVITTCELPQPKWEYHAEKIDVTVGADAKIYHSDFRLHGIPIFYFPYAEHLVDNLGRQTGFLLPNIGQSSQKGTIHRRRVLLGHQSQLRSLAGRRIFLPARMGGAWRLPRQAQRESRPSTSATSRWWIAKARAVSKRDCRPTPSCPSIFAGWPNIDYLNSFIFREAFAESFTQAINSEVKSVDIPDKDHRHVEPERDGVALPEFSGNQPMSAISAFTFLAPRPRPPLVNTGGDSAILIVHAPSFELSSIETRGREIATIRLGSTLAAEGVSRSEPNLDNLGQRGEQLLRPFARPLRFAARSFLCAVLEGMDSAAADRGARDLLHAARTGEYFVQQPGQPASRWKPAWNSGLRRCRRFSIRRSSSTRSSTRSSRAFVYNYVNGVDNFHSIVRFDDRDILSNTNEIMYAFTTAHLHEEPAATSDCPKPLPEDDEDATGTDRGAEAEIDLRRYCFADPRGVQLGPGAEVLFRSDFRRCSALVATATCSPPPRT